MYFLSYIYNISIYLYLYLSTYLAIYLSIYLSTYLSTYLYIVCDHEITQTMQFAETSF